MLQMKVVISGGGTGGHIFPAIAIADAIRSRRPDAQILFVGATGKMEMEKIPAAGYDIKGLPVAGFQRKWSYKNILFPFRLLGSMVKGWNILRQFKPDMAIGVGGYASGPVLKIASWMNIATYLQEQNSYAGVTNRLLAEKASLIFVAYKGMDKFFPKNKIVLSGNPVRKDIVDLAIGRSEAHHKLGLDTEKKTILFLGGSLGAKTINEAVSKAIDNGDLNNYNFIWQIGKSNFNQYQHYQSTSTNRVVKAFMEDMPAVYAAADLVVSRAGALTISELAVLHKACILIPSPYVAEDHQMVNARSLESSGAAKVIEDRNASGQLIPVIQQLINDQSQLDSMQKNISGFAFPDAAGFIADKIIAHQSNVEAAWK
jgi:UDP-N-acetylglucosamine--N-acetylmuramyl-(pentapeptide) pyrophosphoryl-undecaprenol N-acetylglucosamine transferase